MMGRLRTYSAALTAFVLYAVLVGCGKAPDGAPASTGAAGPRAGGQVIVASYYDVTNFNPYESSGESLEAAILDVLFPSLMMEQPDYSAHPPSFSPLLASSWAFSEDNRILTFHLRTDARWSDGVPVTADDVRFTWEVQRSPAIDWPDLDIKDFISDVEVVDPHTVRFHFTQVYPYQLMDANDGPIIPKHAWEKIPFDQWRHTDFEPLLVTSGPFKLAHHTRDQTIILERNPEYWGAPKPYLQRLVFRVIPDTSSQVNQLLAGDVNVVPSLPPREAERVRDDPNVELIEVPSRTWVFLAWNNRHAPFDDRRVRRALTLAINRKAIVDTAYRGFARLSNGPILSTMWAYDRGLPTIGYDPDRARALLAEVGLSDTNHDGVLDRNGKPFAFDLLYPSTNTIREEIALLVQADLAKVGIRARPTAVEPMAFLSRQDSGEFDAALSGWEAATKVDLGQVWETPGKDQGAYNFFGYSNPEVDRLITVAREEPDYTRAKAVFDRIQELIVDDQPVTFLYEANTLVGLSHHVHGADINAATLFFNVEEWYWGP